MPEVEFQLTLIGPWQAYDPADPFSGAPPGDLRRDVDSLGWLAPVQLPNARLALAATMIADDAGETAPLFASVFVHEHRDRLPVELSADGGIVPRRRDRSFDVEWPAPDVGVVRFRQLTYDIPLPGTDRYYSIAFTTPNLTDWTELEYVFDAIVSTAAWVESDA
jgi:hypothetical protein